MNPRPRTRLERARAAVGIAQLALQQIEDELTGDIDGPELAAVLRELHREDEPQSGLLGSLAQLLNLAAQAAGRIEPDGDGESSGPLLEATELVTETAGLRIHYATRTLDPEGEPSW